MKCKVSDSKESFLITLTLTTYSSNSMPKKHTTGTVSLYKNESIN